MGRPKGIKLTAEQKAKMQAGRQRKKALAREGLIDDKEPKIKTKKVQENMILGYAIDCGDDRAFPVFISEEKFYRGRIFSSAKEAKESLK